MLTIEFKINLLAPASGSMFLARGCVIRPGRRITVCTAEVIVKDGTREETIATMLSTLAIMTSDEPSSNSARG